MSVPTPRESFDAILEHTPITQADRDRIRDQLNNGQMLTPEEAYAIPNGAELREAQQQVLNPPPPPAAQPADTTETSLDTADVTLPDTSEVEFDTSEVSAPQTAEVEVGETMEVETR